jgi:hypothetical protein
MTNFSVKNKVLWISALALIYYLLAHQFFFLELVKLREIYIFISPLFLAGLMFLGSLWLLNFKSGFRKYLSITTYSCVNVSAFAFFFEVIIINQTRLGQISITILFSCLIFAIFYVHLLTSNIINYSHIRDIPLVYAARATAYIISLLSEYLIFYMTFNANIDILIKILIVSTISFFHCYFLLDSIKETFANKINSSSTISLLIFIVTIVLSFWPVTSEIKSIILTLIMYICVGISLEIKEKIKKSIWIEYIVLIISIIFLLILLSNWGINGHLL